MSKYCSKCLFEKLIKIPKTVKRLLKLAITVLKRLIPAGLALVKISIIFEIISRTTDRVLKRLYASSPILIKEWHYTRDVKYIQIEC